MSDKEKATVVKEKFEVRLRGNVFLRTRDDSKPEVLVEDRKFGGTMNHPLTRSELGN